MTHECPICEYPGLSEEPFYTYEICPVCNIEFGIEDSFADSEGKILAKDSPERKRKLLELRAIYLTDGPFV